MTRYEIIQNGMKARGRGELLKHLEGKKLTQRQAILGKCFDCMGYYIDGKEDCGVTNCPLERATEVVSEAVALIPPELRFKALKIMAEKTFPAYRLYKYHPCKRTKFNPKMIGLSGDE